MNDFIKTRRGTFQRKPVAAAVALALLSQLPVNQALANAGYGTSTDINGNTTNVPTYFASSPQGIQPAFDPVTHALSTTGLTVDTGTPIRKFVDQLGGVYNGLEALAGMTDLQAGIPVAIPESNWLNPFNGVQTADDYYEIACVEYTERLHTDLAKATRLRGYVQIETAAMVAKGLKDITGVVGSEHIPATYPDGSPILDASGKQVYFVHKPHYLGPAIIASSGKPVRIKFDNYLPYTDVNGVSIGSFNGNGGELAVPVDDTIPGGGTILDANGKPVILPNGQPLKMSENRIAIHWHGGDTPWSNDGTPHQNFAPRGDISYTLGVDARHPDGLGKGESTNPLSVADMPDPGPGSYNMYFPNNLSGRLMMYHDHASGITRVNVYEGMAAGYIVVDPTELTLAANALGTTLATTKNGLPTGLLDAVGIPLVIQDKGFVPKNIGPAAVASDGKTPASQDAKWDLAHWGQPGDFFFPHVYETNQDPNSIDGTNPVGRWDWGPWFWPVFPAQYSLPTGAYGDVTTTPEAFMDTPIVNGQLYPTMTVDPKTYRFRILSVANDRSMNFGLYQAVDGNGVICDANTTPAPNTSTAFVGGMAPGGTLPPALCTEVRMVPAAPTPGFPATWPTDGRVGGVPDPATAGPDIVQIGNEAGLLPQVAVWKSQPITYDQNVRSITVFNVLDHDLLLMGAERADAFIDFSNYAGKTLILYNDAPAPLPGYDPRIDYYTGVGDQTAAGGAYDTLPGYGPNTRTVMQIKVNTAANSASGVIGPRLDVPALTAALPVAYAATQPAPLIPESVYNTAFGTNNTDNYAHIGTGAAAAPYFLVNGAAAYAVTGLAVNYGGSGYTTVPQVTFSAPNTPALAGDVTASATAVVTNGIVTGFTGFNAGSGYTAPPTVTIAAPPAGGTVATATLQATGYPVINKAIQELFDPVFGRMNATLAAELPFSTATVATTIPLAYIDTPIERLDAIKDGETQIWKITHNGVDSHPVHFHLVNVQVINRVGWDGVIKPPSPAEVGWRETLRMNPLEDVYVAVHAVHPVTPYGLPTSERLLDPSQAVGGIYGFTNIDPNTGGAPTFQTYLVNGVTINVPTGQYSNQLTSFDNEYVWHCHILGHEEFDFMRPFIFHPNVQVPDAPANVQLAGNTVTWVDTTPYGGQDAQGIPTAGTNAAYPTPTSSPKNEIGFNVFDNGVKVNTAPIPANSTSWTSPVALVGPVTVVAYNAAGTSLPGTSGTTTSAGGLVGAGGVTPPVSNVPPIAPAAAAGPTGLTQVVNADGSVTLSWVAVPGATAYTVMVNGVATTCTVTTVGTAASCTVAAASLNGANNTLTVSATTLSGTTAATSVAGGLNNSQTLPPVAFAGVADTAPGSITLVWANAAANKNNVAGLLLTWTSTDTGAKNGSFTFKPTTTGATLTGLPSGGTGYVFTLKAVSNVAAFNSGTVTTAAIIAN